MASSGNSVNQVDLTPLSRDTSSGSRGFPHFGTLALHAGQEPEQWKSLAVIPPISLSTTFKQYGPGDHAGYEYSRSGNPTRDCLEKCIAALEDAKYCLVYSSGLSATTNIAHLLVQGDHIVSVNDVYGGTNRYFRHVVSKYGIQSTFVDATNPDNVVKALKNNTKMVWLETPTNPTLAVIDVRAVVTAVKAVREDIFVVVDNTFLSSYFQRPLNLGADMVMHSLTKYMNGHTDVVMGAVALSDERYHHKLRYLQNALGGVPSPFDCYMVNRGLKTLHLRMREHERNAFAVAAFLEKSERVTKVLYPGLPSHPQHEVAKKQCQGFGGMVTFYIKGSLQEASTFLKAVKVFTLAESLGGFESLCEHPALMTHASVAEDEREMLGISNTLIRLSVGLEDTADLVEDLGQALRAAVK